MNKENSVDKYLISMTQKELARLQGELGATSDKHIDRTVHLRLLEELSVINIRLSIIEQTLVSSDRLHSNGDKQTVFLLPATQFFGHSNLYGLEHNDKGCSYRWTGPEPQTTFVLVIPRYKPYELSFRVVGIIDSEQLKNMTVKVDGREKRHIYRHYYGGKSIICRIPKRTASDPSQITITIAKPKSPSELGISNDTRKLGIAIAEIRVSTPPNLIKRTLRYLHWQRLVFWLHK